MRIAMVLVVVLGFAATWGCSSSKAKSNDTNMMAMHCSKCNADLKAGTTMKCKCGSDVVVGDLNVKCSKCNAEVKMSDCHGSCPKCGAAMSQETCKVKCPKCGGEVEARKVSCPHCADMPAK